MLKKWSVVLEVQAVRPGAAGCRRAPRVGAQARVVELHLKNHGVHFEHTHLCARSGPVLARDRQAAGNNTGPHAQNVPRGS